jgi:hypothetical protein
MQYTTAVPYPGRFAPAGDRANQFLTPLGFRLIDRTPSSVEFEGPGMNSTRESPLLGATRIHLTHRSGELAVDADLGGVQRMTRFITWFPAILCIAIGLLVVGVFAVVLPEGVPIAAIAAGGVAAVNLLLWAVLGPIMCRALRARSQRALDAFVGNLAAAGSA